MALTKAESIDKMTIKGPYNNIELRTAIVIVEDGKELGTHFKYEVLKSGTLDSNDALVDTDVSGYSAEIQGVAAAVWTTAVKEAWRKQLVALK